MTGLQSTPPLESQSPTEGNIRKRVCKACDRCRLKKSKCDGANPCGRCKTDNAICVFGERKKAHDKVYPKGYVEMLEQQQAQLVAGLQELYRRALEGQGWPGSPLKPSSNGHPLTHDILERLGALKQDGKTENDTFEEDLSAVQRRLLANGAVMQRQDSSDESSNGGSSPRFRPNGVMFPTERVPVAKFPPTPPNYSPYGPAHQGPRLMHVQPAHRHSLPAVQPPTRPQPQRISDPAPVMRPQPHPYAPKQQPPPSAVSQFFFPPPQTAVSADMNIQQPHLQQTAQRRPSWSQMSEGSTLDDSLNIFPGFDAQSLPLDGIDYFHRPVQMPRQPPPANLNAYIGQPDWNDEDLKVFFNPSPSLLS